MIVWIFIIKGELLLTLQYDIFIIEQNFHLIGLWQEYDYFEI